MTKALLREIGKERYTSWAGMMWRTPRFKRGVKECIVDMRGRRGRMITEDGLAMLMAATVEQLDDMPGLGPETAQVFYAKLHQLREKGVI